MLKYIRHNLRVSAIPPITLISQQAVSNLETNCADNSHIKHTDNDSELLQEVVALESCASVDTELTQHLSVILCKIKRIIQVFNKSIAISWFD